MEAGGDRVPRRRVDPGPRRKERALPRASAPAGPRLVEATGSAKPGPEEKAFSSYAFGAVFVEIRVDAELGMVRVPRMIGAYDVGRVINPKTARSQCIGGMVGGIGMALMEQAEWDARMGRVMNANLAEHLVPVNTDVVDLDVTSCPARIRTSIRSA